MIPFIIAGAIGFGIAKLLEKDDAEKFANGGNAGDWSVTDTTNAEYLGVIEFQDNEGEFHNFEIMETDDRLVFGGMTNSGFIESGYIEKDGFSTDETLQSLLEDLEVYYNDGAEYTSQIVFNQRMAQGGDVYDNSPILAVRNYDADYFVNESGDLDDNGTIKRYAIEIQSVPSGDVIEYTSAYSEKEASEMIKKINATQKVYADGGMTNEDILRSFLTSEKQTQTNNLATYYNEYDNQMLLRNYQTLIATRMGRRINITNVKHSVTTTKITNRLKALAEEMGYSVFYVSEFAQGGIAQDSWRKSGEGNLSIAETKKVAKKYAEGLTMSGEGIFTVNPKVEENSFDLDFNDQEYDGGSYIIYGDGSVVNMAVNPSERYGSINSTPTQIKNKFIDIQKQYKNAEFKDLIRNDGSVYGKRMVSELKYENGGGTYVDLFEDYENIPLKVQKILDKYAEEFGDDFGGMDYKDTQNMLEEIEEVGYTFGYGLDNQPYGLRPMGVRLNQLKNYEDYDDDEMAKGGETFMAGGMTNEDILRSFLTSNRETQTNNLATFYSTLGAVMLLRNYGTLIAKRNGRRVEITNVKHSKTTSAITNRLKALAEEMGYNVSYVSEFENGGEMQEEKFRYKDFYQSQGGIKFKTEEEAERFIKTTKPFVRKQLREGNFVLVFNGKEYFIGEKIKINDEYAEGGGVSAKLKKLKSEMKQIWEETGEQYSDKKEMLMSAGYDDSDSNDLKHEEWKYLGNDVQIKLINDYFAYYEKLAVYVQGVGSIYNGTSMQSAVNKANSYLKNNPKAEIVISDEKYGDTYDLDGYKIDEEYAVGGLAKKRRRSASAQYGRSDRSVDKQRSAKPVGYRFTDEKATQLNKKTYTKPTEAQVKKYLGNGIYKENRKNRSDKNRRVKL